MFKKILFLICLLFTLSLFISCSGGTPELPYFNTGEPATPDELKIDRLFPSQSVKQWVYNYREFKYSYYYEQVLYEFNATEKWDVLENSSEGSHTYITIDKYGEGYFRSSKIYFKKTPSSLHWWGIKFSYDNYIRGFEGKLLLFPVQANSSWDTIIPFESHDQYLHLGKGRNTVSTISEEVYTPAGTFSHCVRNDFTATDTQDIPDYGYSTLGFAITFWFAPDVGIVKIKSVLTIDSFNYPEKDDRFEIYRTLESYEWMN